MSWDKYSKLEAFLRPEDPKETLLTFDEFWARRDKIIKSEKRRTASLWTAAASSIAAAVIAVILFVYNFRSDGFYGPDGRIIAAGWANSSTNYITSRYNGHRIALSPEARVSIGYEKPAGRVRIILDSGKILCHPRHLKTGEEFRVVLPGAEVTAIGTVFSVDSGGGKRRLTVAEGRVLLTFTKSGTNMEVPAGRTVEWNNDKDIIQRETDNQDLNDIRTWLGYISARCDWSLDLGPDPEAVISAGSGGDLYVSAGPELWKLEGVNGAKKVFHNRSDTVLGKPVTFRDRVAVGSPFGGIWVFDGNGKEIAFLSDAPGSLAFVPMSLNTATVVNVAIDSSVMAYGYGKENYTKRIALENENVFAGTVLSPDGKTLYLATDAGALVCYNLEKNKPAKRIPVFYRRIEFPPVLTDGGLVLFDRASGKFAYIDTRSMTAQYLTVPFMAGNESFPVPGGKGVYWRNSGDRKGRILFTGFAGNKPVSKVIAELGGVVNGLSFSEGKLAAGVDGKILIVMNADGKILRRENFTGNVLGNDGFGIYAQYGSLLKYHLFSAE